MSQILAHSLEENTRTEDVVISENVSFQSLFLSEDIFKGLFQTGFRKPSPIQLKAIPVGRCGFDLIVKSKSGTGKTLVFSIIALENIDRTKKELQALILAPTREIAVQIQDVIKQVGCNIEGLTVESFIGGLSFEDDREKCKKCQIAVGTPGRIKHLISEGILTCQSTRLFVLDEADKLMEASFRNDINLIYNALPAKKQIITTSATYPDGLAEFIAQYMQSPTHVNAELETPLLLGLKQFVSVMKPYANVVQQMKTKNEELLNVLGKLSFTQCLVFSNYQTRAESISNYLNQKGWSSMFISAAQSQTKRLTALHSLREFKCRIMLCTDLAARGVDAANVDLVINYDIPMDPMTYLHRMGRAGRYGAQGVCLNLTFDGQELEKLRVILGQIGGTALGIPKLPTFEGHISDLVKIHIPSDEQIFGKLDDSHVDLTWDKNKIYELKKKTISTVKSPLNQKEINIENTNGEQIISILDNTDNKPGNMKKTKSNLNPRVVSNSLTNQSLVQNKTEVDELKNHLADMDPQAILASLVNQTFSMESETIELSNGRSDTQSSIPKSTAKCDTMFQNETSNTKLIKTDALLALLDPENSDRPATHTSNTIKELSEEQKRQQLFAKNKALLDVVRELDSPNNSKASVDGSSIAQYLNILEEQDKTKIIALSEKSVPAILDTIQAVEPAKENISAGSFDLENVFKLGYDCIVKSNDTGWKQILKTVEQREKSSSEELPMDGLEDEESGSMGQELENSKEVEIMKWVPVEKTSKTPNIAKNLLEASEDEDETNAMEESGEGELTKWMPACASIGAVQGARSSETVSEEVHRYEHFGSYFAECDRQLWQNGLNFDNLDSFDEWFYYEWEAQLYAMRNYVQQNIYVQEMSRYQNSGNNK